MAVYTVLTKEELAAALAGFDLGHLVDAEAVGAGIENTTYFVTFDAGHAYSEYVLTIGESIGANDMHFVATLTTALSADGLPVPAPVRDRSGASLFEAGGKPALLIPRVRGKAPVEPTPVQCRAIGNALGALHGTTSKLALAHDSHRGLDWVRGVGKALLPHLPETSRQLMEQGLIDLDRFVTTHPNLPRALIHGDLFRDNTLFEGDRLVAIIDFFSAGTGYLLFDLAVVANDWCLADERDHSPEALQELLSGYAAIRPPTREEQDCWGRMLGIAALRFCVSRWADRVFPSPNRHHVPPKDPAPYEKLLRQHQRHPLTWP